MEFVQFLQFEPFVVGDVFVGSKGRDDKGAIEVFGEGHRAQEVLGLVAEAAHAQAEENVAVFVVFVAVCEREKNEEKRKGQMWRWHVDFVGFVFVNTTKILLLDLKIFIQEICNQAKTE